MSVRRKLKITVKKKKFASHIMQNANKAAETRLLNFHVERLSL